MMNTRNDLEVFRPRMTEGNRMGFVQILLTLAITVMMGVLSTSAMYANDLPPPYRLPVFGGTVGLILMLSVGRVGTFSGQKLLMLFLWGGFGSMCLISGMLNRDDMLALIWMSVGVPYLIFCVFPEAAGRHGNIMVQLAILFAFVPYAVVSLFLYPVDSPYSGVFSNSNTFGITAATLSAGIFALLRGSIAIQDKTVFRWAWILFLCAGAAAALFLVLISNSRTSLVTYLTLMLIFMGSLWFNFRRNRWWIALSVLLVMGAVAVILFSGFVEDPRGNYLGRIVDKMMAKAVVGDATSGRTEIWYNVMNSIDWFGHGIATFTQNFGGLAHNTYFTVLGAVGPLALAFLLPVHAMALYLALRHFRQNIRHDGYAAGPLLVVVNYLMLGLAELVFGVLGNGINMSFLLMTGFLVNADPVPGLEPEASRPYESAGLTGSVSTSIGGHAQ